MAKGERPDFNVRAKVGDRWLPCGVAWHARDGAISVRLNTLPVGSEWDGSVTLFPPKEDDGA